MTTNWYRIGFGSIVIESMDVTTRDQVPVMVVDPVALPLSYTGSGCVKLRKYWPKLEYDVT